MEDIQPLTVRELKKALLSIDDDLFVRVFDIEICQIQKVLGPPYTVKNERGRWCEFSAYKWEGENLSPYYDPINIPGPVTITLTGKQGTGKSTLGREIEKLLSLRYLDVILKDELQGVGPGEVIVEVLGKTSVPH